MQLYANRQPSMSSHVKEENISTKINQHRSIENKLMNKNIPSVISDISNGTLARKKSHGLLRKDSKK